MRAEKAAHLVAGPELCAFAHVRYAFDFAQLGDRNFRFPLRNGSIDEPGDFLMEFLHVVGGI
jgi:hypothetical protein